MTRAKEIMKEADKVASANTQIIGDWGEHYMGFIHGAEWADSHPRWISVEDELPPYNKNVLVYDAEHPYFEFWWARRYAKGSGRLLDKNGFTTLTDEVNVTHWMYINPPIPNPNLEDNSKKGGEA